MTTFINFYAKTGLLLLCAVMLLHCNGPRQVESELHFGATIPPLAAVLRELTGDRAQVMCLLPPGASPHTYSLKPSDMRTMEALKGLFYIHEQLDGWAADLAVSGKIECADLVAPPFLMSWEEHGGHNHGDDAAEQAHDDVNPHFWGDPRAIESLVPALVKTLSTLDPDGATHYEGNARRFTEDLQRLDQEVQGILEGVKRCPVMVFHPSWDYFFARYNIPVAAVIEPFPGKEPTPRHLQQLIAQATEEAVCALFTEPQLPRRPAEVISETIETPLFELDPLGGGPGRESYRDLIMYNARLIRDALQ
jgi:zinc transport system substrate-binding protein